MVVINSFNNEQVDNKNVKVFTEKCLSQISKEALVTVSANGGLYTDWDMMYLREAYNASPTIEEIEKSLSGYVNDHLNNCLKDFNSIKGKRIGVGDINTTTMVNAKDVTFNLNMPITINNSKNSISTLTDFSVMHDIRYDEMYGSSQHSVALTLNKGHVFEIKNDNLHTDITFQGDAAVFSISDPKFEDIRLIFGIKK